LKNQPTNDLGESIDEIAAEFVSGAHVLKGRKLSGGSWGGAGVIVTSDKLRTGDEGDFVLVTPDSAAVSWYFDRVRRIAYSEGGIDHLSKHVFFRDLAKAVADRPQDADEQRVFKTLLAETRTKLSISCQASKG
jgi:hypothetical protein